MDPRKMRKIFPLHFCCIIKSYNHIITKPLLSHAQGIKLNGVHKSPQYLVDGPISNSSTPDKALKKENINTTTGYTSTYISCIQSSQPEAGT